MISLFNIVLVLWRIISFEVKLLNLKA